MNSTPLRAGFLIFLALVFTIGLTFATVELPYIIDDFLQNTIPTPGFDSHANDISILKADLFIDHYHLRLIGYTCFGLTVLLIIAGFISKRSGFAAIGAFAFMLPVFAQFAGVMFFLAGLGLLNILWLPVLDISFELQKPGLIIRAPYDLLMWLFRQAGINGYWPVIYFFIGGGLLIFFLGTYTWLSARGRHRNVADFWIYRISRHPQYLGWILWSYGMYLLLMLSRYPKRSWGIDASLPWLLSTMVIIGVALLEEVNMKRRYGDSYAAYRRKTPFLFPLPKIITSLFALPMRVIYGRESPERKREVAVVISLYTALLIGASVFFYGGGTERLARIFSSPEEWQSNIEETAAMVRDHPNWRAKYFIAERLAAYGEPAIDHFIRLMKDEQDEVRILSARYLGKLPSERSVPVLIGALNDPNETVRGRAVESLAQIGSRDAIDPMVRLLNDPSGWVRRTAAGSLAELGATDIADSLIAGLNDPDMWTRIDYINALGELGTKKALPSIIDRLNDEKPLVRQAAVIALMKIGSPVAYEALERALQDEDREVRIYAAEALKQLKRETRK